jgi:hypothetical protein
VFYSAGVRQPSAASLKEYERLSRFVSAAWAQISNSGKLPPELLKSFPTEEERALRTANVRFSDKLSGMREAANDMVVMLQGLFDAMTPEQLDARLAADGAPTYTEMRERRWQTIAGVLRRRAINTEDEQRLVLDVLADIGPRGPTLEEREILNALITKAESVG